MDSVPHIEPLEPQALRYAFQLHVMDSVSLAVKAYGVLKRNFQLHVMDSRGWSKRNEKIERWNFQLHVMDSAPWGASS